MKNTRKMGAYLKEGLQEIQKEYPELGDIRQAGLHIGVELVKDPDTKEPIDQESVAIRTEAIELGLILGTAGPHKNILKVKPPLIVNHSECDEILDKLKTAMKIVLRG